MNGYADFMGVKILTADKADIIGRHHRQRFLCRQLYRSMQIAFLILAAGTDKLQIEAVREVGLPEFQRLLHQGAVTAQQKLTHIPLAPAGENNQPFFMINQPVALNGRSLCTVAFLIGFGDKQGQVLITGIIACQNRE